MSNSISAIIQTTQTMDLGILMVFGKTCAVVLQPSPVWTCVTTQSETYSSPFGAMYTLFSFGYLLVMAICMPLSFLSLADNVIITMFMFFLTAVIYVQWIVASFVEGIGNIPIPAVASTSSLANSLGVIILNYALIYTVPSWINIRRKDIKIQTVIWTSTMAAMVSYIAIGLIRTFYHFSILMTIAALAFNISSDADLFGVFIKSNNKLNSATAFIYALVIIMSGIPINFIIARDNLYQTNAFNPCTL